MSQPILLALAVVASQAAGVPLYTYYASGAKDNFVAATAAGEQYAAANGYTPVGSEGAIASNTTQAANTIPLYQFYSTPNKDHVLTANKSGPGEGYQMLRIEGFAKASAGAGLLQLRQYYSAARQDHFLCVEGSVSEQNALNAKYVLLGVEAYAAAGPLFPPFLWNSTVPTTRGEQCPFPPSSAFSSVQFTGFYANYGGADTWYPSWAADGNLYTPWTDGNVNGVGAGSGCATDGCMSTTGFATVIGDDPLSLNVTAAGTFSSSPSPYHGRYPCGSLYYKGIWFYGTYTLDNENHQPGTPLGRQPLERGADTLKEPSYGRAGYCENWCIQGPFVGFRTSLDQGNTWNEPRVHMANASDNLFGESAPDNHTSKVKFGAPHVVDFGRELEHSPDGKMYIVGHGASEPYSPTSWMQASEVYMARVSPTVAAVEDRSQWQFFAGQNSDGTDKWASGDVSQAKPILTWANTTGVTTMTYLPAVKKYILCISTPTFSPFTERQFDTYLLESSSLTGPFSMVTYMREFGPESYFVNIPSKFVASEVDADGSLTMYLSYSANFAFRSQANPPGSGYHWTLQQIKLSP